MSYGVNMKIPGTETDANTMFHAGYGRNADQ